MSFLQDLQILFVQFFHIQLGLSWFDVLFMAIFLFYMIEGYALGFINALLDLISFIVSFAVALKWYAIAGSLLLRLFSMPVGFANAFGFFLTATFVEIASNALLRIAAVPLHPRVIKNKQIVKLNNILGIVPGFFSAFVLLSFLLTLIVSLPLSPYIKSLISSSRIGSYLVANTAGLEKNMNDVFGGAIHETLNFLTVEPQSDQTVNLKFTTKNVTVDPQAEGEMLQLVNKERTTRGLAPLVMDGALREVARLHSRDMFARGYFSHYTPDGLSPFDRMEKANISYTYAGENLALAPNTALAMQGLMNSPGHKANILSPNFKRVGIGVIDGGIYGEMFSQEFTD